MNSIAKKPEVLVGCALAAGLVFLNSTYKVPGAVLAREKTGYVPDAIKESDTKKSLVRRNSWGTALFDASNHRQT